MFKFGAAFLFSSTLPPKHLLNLKALPTNQNELIKVFLNLRIVLSQNLLLTFSCWSCLSWFRALSTILRASLCTACYTCCIQCTTYDVITYTRKVLYTTTTNQNELIKVFSKGLTRQVYYFLPFPAGAACPGFGRLAPYFERLCVRPATPAVSNVPRTM